MSDTITAPTQPIANTRRQKRIDRFGNPEFWTRISTVTIRGETISTDAHYVVGLGTLVLVTSQSNQSTTFLENIRPGTDKLGNPSLVRI